MKKTLGKFVLCAVIIMVAAVLITACVPVSQNETSTPGTQTAVTSGAAQTTATEEVVYIEWWRTNQAGITWDKDGPVSKFLIEKTGVGSWMPLVLWEGGVGYSDKFQLRVATGELPDLFLPRLGIEATLALDGMIWELSEYLPKYAPNLWNGISEEIWDVVRTADPTGKGGIYYVPLVQPYNNYGSFIRKDWLDAAGLAVPTTQDEYVNALRAFKARGKDILPTIGREYGRWMDHLFYMYDVSMYEGYPVFDIYDGKMTYSGITQNMKEALAFIHQLYEEKLLDNETFLNKSNNLWEKVQSNRVGSWYHIPVGAMGLLDFLKEDNNAEMVLLPRIAAPGYDGYITVKYNWGPLYAFGKNDEEKLIAALKMLNWLSDPANAEEIFYGVEGVHHNVVDGKKVIIQDVDENTTESKVSPPIQTFDTILMQQDICIAEAQDPLVKKATNMTKAAMLASQKDMHRVMAEDGMPAVVYDGYPDIKAHKLYQEYMTQIIIGDLPIDAFDEFVVKWKSTGGDEVTKRAQEWYDNVNK